MAGTNPSNFETARELVAKLADPAFHTRIQADPTAAANEVTALLAAHGATPPPKLPDLLVEATKKGAGTYAKLLDALDTSPLAPADVESVLKLAPPPVFGIHCDKLA